VIFVGGGSGGAVLHERVTRTSQASSEREFT
jgi:hypothetical protein